jgi:hypothetical protein
MCKSRPLRVLTNRNTLPSVFVSGPKIHVGLSSLKTGQYQVGNFFSAVHAIVTQRMPSDRPLAEYVVILVLVTKLLSRLIAQIRNRLPPRQSKLLSNTVSLAVVQTMSTPPLSAATIGFSACGSSRQRRAIANLRKQYLPHLSRLQGIERVTEWSPGNCAEPEVFAHLPAMKRSLKMRATERGQPPSKIICVALTLTLAKLDVSQLYAIEGKEFCELCRTLAQNMAAELDCPILDLCPPP